MKRLKILLISPPRGLIDGNVKKPKFQTHPLGLLYLAGVLEKNNYQVKILDALSHGNSIDEINLEVSEFSPHVVGITAMTIQARDAYMVAESVKTINPKTITVMGGPHATALPEEGINSGYIDFAVIGEGEYSLLEICDKVEKGDKEFCDVKGIVYKNGRKIIKTSFRENLDRLDEIPFPAYHLLPSMARYNPPPHWGKKGKFGSVITSRGCPYGCEFCSVTRAFGKKYRVRSSNNVLDELEVLYKDYGVRYVSFRDSVFTLLKKRVIEICRGIVDMGMDIKWNCNGRVNEVNEEMLLWMKKAGCKAIQYGIESGNEEILSRFKRLNKDTIRKAVNLTNKVGIEPHGYFMFGLPGETKKSMRDTINFAKSLNLHSAGFTTVTPFPGSELWEYCIENNLVLSTDWEKYDLKGLPVSRHLNLKAEEILNAQKAAFREFYMRPKIIFRQLKNIRSANDILNYLFEALINLGKNKKMNQKAH